MEEIPLFIFHIGDQEYFKKCVNHNSQKNKVYIMGNDTNKDLFSNNKNVFFYHVKDVNNVEVNKLKFCFTNYSTHDVSYEIKCFLRVFYLKQIMLLTGIHRFFHLDSDCVIFDNITDIFNSNPEIKNAYSVQKHCKDSNPYHMVGCIHNGLLTLDLCNIFIKLCFDIYGNKSKMYLLNDKINYHKQNNIGGGICDMTFFWLIYSEKLCEVFDLNDIIIFENEECIFDHNINNDYGIYGEGTYKMKDNVKELIVKDGKRYITTLNDDKLIRVLSLHFAGPAKKILEELS
jgi:hypothetical protein